MLSKFRNQMNTCKVRHLATFLSVKIGEHDLNKAQEELSNVEQAQAVTQAVAQTIQQHIHNRIAGVVTQCLHSVFPEPYDFRITFERKRGRTEARLVFVREELEIDPMTGSGGGVIDVAAFALRLASLILQRPPVRRLLVLDEPFRFVSKEHLPKVRSMLESLSKEMGVQFILVTHLDALQIGTVVEL